MNKVFIPEKCDKELHQVHDAAVLREGYLSKKKKGGKDIRLLSLL